MKVKGETVSVLSFVRISYVYVIDVHSLNSSTFHLYVLATVSLILFLSLFLCVKTQRRFEQ